MTQAFIAGTGSYLPKKCLSNEELVSSLEANGIESSNSWIVERTGIRFRHFADEVETSSYMGAIAAKKALEAAGIEACELDLIVCATSTPDMVFPSTACLIQKILGARGCAAFDVQAVCTGFIYALSVADAMIRSGSVRHALVVGAEVFSRLLDFEDRGTCVLFGDGAGAVVLTSGDKPGILSTVLHANGEHADALKVPSHVSAGLAQGRAFVEMDGQAVFKLAVQHLYDASIEVLHAAGKSISAVDWMIPHQANIRIMGATANRLGLPFDKVVVTLEKHGNTSAASIPLALDHAIGQGHIRRGQSLLLAGVGAGFTWGAALIEY